MAVTSSDKVTEFYSWLWSAKTAVTLVRLQRSDLICVFNDLLQGTEVCKIVCKNLNHLLGHFYIRNANWLHWIYILITDHF